MSHPMSGRSLCLLTDPCFCEYASCLSTPQKRRGWGPKECRRASSSPQQTHCWDAPVRFGVLHKMLNLIFVKCTLGPNYTLWMSWGGVTRGNGYPMGIHTSNHLQKSVWRPNVRTWWCPSQVIVFCQSKHSICHKDQRIVLRSVLEMATGQQNSTNNSGVGFVLMPGTHAYKYLHIDIWFIWNWLRYFNAFLKQDLS